MEFGVWMATLGLVVTACIHHWCIQRIANDTKALGRRLEVVEGLLSAKGLLPEEPREVEAGTARLTIVKGEEGPQW